MEKQNHWRSSCRALTTGLLVFALVAASATLSGREAVDAPPVPPPHVASAKPNISPHPDLAPGSRLAINVKNAPYHAAGDGVTDDTAAFSAALTAAGAGGAIFVPRGTYRIGDLAFTHEGQTIAGEGGLMASGTVLKAKAGATYVLKNQGLRYQRLSNLVIHGNERASRGFLTESTASGTSQSIVLDRVWFYRCTVGFHIGNAGLTQADKNTLYNPAFVECDVGLWNNSVNGQETVLHNAEFTSTYDTSARIWGGGLTMLGGQFQGGEGSKGIEFTGANIHQVLLQDVIFEGPKTDIYSDGAWPQDGLTAINTIFQGKTANLRIGGSSSKFYAIGCRFNGAAGVGGGKINCEGPDTLIWLLASTWGVPLLEGTNLATAHIHRQNISGITLTNQDVVMDTAARGLVLKDAREIPHYWRVTVNNSGALVTNDLGTTRP